MPAAISGMERVQLLSLSHAGDCFATLAMTGMHIVIARVLAPAAISGMERVQSLSLSHAGDCFALLAMTGLPIRICAFLLCACREKSRGLAPNTPL